MDDIPLVVHVLEGAVISGILIYLLPAVAGANRIWFAMPITELAVAIFVITLMAHYTKQLSAEKQEKERQNHLMAK